VRKKETPADWYHQSIRVDILQRFWHRRRFEEVVAQIEPVDGTVLDVGCNDGTFSKIIYSKTGAKKLVGIDVVKPAIAWAAKHWQYPGMKFLVGDAHHLKFKNGSFAAVFCLEVLEHLEDPLKALRELKRVLQKGGYGIFLVPSDSFLFRLIWFFWLHFYPRGWVWRETHIQTFRKDSLLRLCRKTGFKIEVNKKFNLGMLHLVEVRKK